VQARLRRQILNLEDDELPHHARRHIAGRIAELEDKLTGYQASLARIHQQPDPAPPDALTLRELLATFPVNGVELRKLGQTDLRELLASLNLLVRYDHTRHAVQLHLTLTRSQGDGFWSVVCSGGRTRTYNLGLNRALSDVCNVLTCRFGGLPLP
jgi:hypothetical protein